MGSGIVHGKAARTTFIKMAEQEQLPLRINVSNDVDTLGSNNSTTEELIQAVKTCSDAAAMLALRPLGQPAWPGTWGQECTHLI